MKLECKSSVYVVCVVFSIKWLLVFFFISVFFLFVFVRVEGILYMWNVVVNYDFYIFVVKLFVYSFEYLVFDFDFFFG